MKIFKHTGLGLTALALLVTSQSAFSEGKVKMLLQCSTGGPGGFPGGVTVYREEHDYIGMLRGSINDNYMNAPLVCKEERDKKSIRCVGLWSYNQDTVESVQLRLRKSQDDSGYLLDIAKRSRIHGGKPVLGLQCVKQR